MMILRPLRSVAGMLDLHGILPYCVKRIVTTAVALERLREGWARQRGRGIRRGREGHQAADLARDPAGMKRILR